MISAGVLVASMVKIAARAGRRESRHGVELAGLRRVGGEAGKRAPAERRAVVGQCGGDLRIGGGAFGALVDHDMRAGEAVLDEVGLVGGDQQIARRDGDQAFRADARGQELEELAARRRCPCRRRQRGALGGDEDQLVVAEGADLEAFRLDALLVAGVGIVAGIGRLVFEGRAGFVGDRAGLVEDGEAARAALVVAFVGDDEAVVVEPFHGVGLAQRRFPSCR